MTEAAPPSMPLLKQWSAELVTRSGLRLFVRSVTSEDDQLIDRFFASLSHEDLRFRFLTPLAHPSVSLLEALIKVDHVRTEDFLVFADVAGDKELVASAMLAADPSLSKAEVAIAIRPAFKQKGIGWTLLDFVARDARARGIKILEAIECRDNKAALEVEKQLGFVARPCPGDASLTLVRKILNERD